ncbi:MAG: helix-turn-helix transcriptional regulator [Chloroflexota bacterium]
MPASVRRLDEANRLGDRLRRELGDELRRARLIAGISQGSVGRALGCSAATISRVERGRVSRLTIRHLARHAAVLGLVLRINMLPLGSAIRDAGQLRVLNRLAPHIGPPWRWIIEMLVAPHDLRAFDAGALQPGCRVAFDIWSRVRDVQAQARASLRKQLDGGADRLILVFAETEANRRQVREAGEALRRSFPLTTRQVLAALHEGRDPSANGIVFI